MMAPSTIVEEPGLGRLEIFPLEPSPAVLERLLRDVFARHWHEVSFGPMVQGAVFAMRPKKAPTRITLADGTFSADFGDWHVHLCIGPQAGPARNPIPPDIAAGRRCQRAEMIRLLGDTGTPRSWALRLFNGLDEQMLTVFFPNPYEDDEGKVVKTPDWSRLAMWDAFRRTYLDLDPDPIDRRATGFGAAAR
jgi:hypothetical protein